MSHVLSLFVLRESLNLAFVTEYTIRACIEGDFVVRTPPPAYRPKISGFNDIAAYAAVDFSPNSIACLKRHISTP